MAEKIGLLYHPKLARSQELAKLLEKELARLNAESWTGSAWDDQATLDAASELDCLITLGGDGTIVRAARVVAALEVPILAVNLGRVGFLAETEPAEVIGVLPRLLAHNYRVEQRTMLHAIICHKAKPESEYYAVNEVVAGRGGMARVVRVSTYVNDEYVTTYVADGVIVATATGSTAYAVAAGGPILDPSLDNLLLVPVAPHPTIARALVLPHDARVRLEISSDHDVSLTIDGQVHCCLNDGDSIKIGSAELRAHFVRFSSPAEFYRNLVKRLHSPDEVI